MKILLAFICLFSYLFSFSQGSLEVMGNYVYPPDVHCSGLTGYTDADGKEYAIVCTTGGLDFIDVSNPVAPVLKAICPYITKSVRVYKQYAYATRDGGDGLSVIDLSQLSSGQINYHQVLPQTANGQHTIFIDENGIAYLNGVYTGVLWMLDLNVDAWNPPIIGSYNNAAVHDCYVRNDTMWAACINEGEVRVIDIRDKTRADSASSLLASFNTPANFTHNVSLSDDGNYLFTTDERTPSYLACYDVSDLTNVVETDRILLQNDNAAIVHNVNYKDGYCYSAAYTYGIVVHNVANKHNIIEESYYDTSPRTGTSFWGVYDVWPYLPSGYILATDAETGLWIFKSTVNSPCYITGTVTNQVCGNILYNASVDVLQSSIPANTDINGIYNTYTYDSTLISMRISAPGYVDTVIQVLPIRDSTLHVDVALRSLQPMGVFTIICKDKDSQEPVNAQFIIKKANSDSISIVLNTNTDGVYNYCGLDAGNYVLYMGKWGYVTDSVSITVGANNDSTIALLKRGYYDDFLFTYPWTRTATATWLRAEPIGTEYNGAMCNPNSDVETDFGKHCFVTGNVGPVNSNDVDEGTVQVLTSPVLDLSNYQDPVLSYYRWYINGHTEEGNDWFRVYAQFGTETVVIDEAFPNNIVPGWNKKSIHLRDYVPVGNNAVTISFSVIDMLPDNITEAAIDEFRVDGYLYSNIEEVLSTNQLSVYPNPFSNAINLKFSVPLKEKLTVAIYDLAGKMLIEKLLNENTLNVSLNTQLPAGVYILKAYNPRDSYTSKLFKMN